MRHQKLYELAPLALLNYRTRRYHGGDICLPLTTFADEDQARLRTLYDFLLQLLQRLSPQPAEGAGSDLAEFLRDETPDKIARLATQIGKLSYALQPTPLMAQTLHDLRGGGLTPLLGQLQLAPRTGVDPATFRTLYFLTRDHLKIMRNAVIGLDDPRRDEDFLLRVHGTDLLVEKWHGVTLHEGSRDLRVEVEAPPNTAIGECCVEFGSVDRILYNLINNACRHSASDLLRMVMFLVPEADGTDVRFVLQNNVSEADLVYLRSVRPATLFQEGTSTTGSGCGLAIVAEFVSRAYGLANPAQALAEGYLGATVLDDSFTVWFHWPRVLRLPDAAAEGRVRVE